MGRNAIPKIGEWRDGALYSFQYHGSPYSSSKHVSDGGQTITYHREDRDGVTILGHCYADGFEECMAAMWSDGYMKGKKEGYKDAQKAIHLALGVSSA